MDGAEGGGNPFASALIEAADDVQLQLCDLGARLREGTADKSEGLQVVECLGHPRLPAWTMNQGFGPVRERRDALLLVVSDYSEMGPHLSLGGAARDERRVAAMLARHGFSVEQGVGPRRRELVAALVAFGRRSQRSDLAVIYSTGHAVELEGVVHLLPGDYPRQDGFGVHNLRRHAISVPRIVDAASAEDQNIVFFAGCRTHPR